MKLCRRPWQLFHSKCRCGQRSKACLLGHFKHSQSRRIQCSHVRWRQYIRCRCGILTGRHGCLVPIQFTAHDVEQRSVLSIAFVLRVELNGSKFTLDRSTHRVIFHIHFGFDRVSTVYMARRFPSHSLLTTRSL